MPNDNKLHIGIAKTVEILVYVFFHQQLNKIS